MDATIKAAWVADLRANPDKQAKGTLFERASGRYCCLGRLMLVQGREPEEWIRESHLDDFGEIDEHVIDEDLCTTELPDGYRAGVNMAQAEHLAGMNDGAGPFSPVNDLSDVPADKRRAYSFAEIADYIEANL